MKNKVAPAPALARFRRTGRVSIVIPCFNAAATIGETINSACAQTDVEREIVVIDDGSTDRSLEIARSFEPHVRVLSRPNRGVSAARNLGIAETTGGWIVFLDADDLLLSGTLRRRLETAEATFADAVVCDWQEVFVRGNHTVDGTVKSVDVAALKADPEIACATDVWAPPAALVYRRDLVEKIGGFREGVPPIEDARFLFDAAYHGAQFVHLPYLGARYRISPQSFSRRDPAQFWRSVHINGTQIENLWRARAPLSAGHRKALKLIYNSAARELFAAGDPQYFGAVASLRRLGGELPRHPRIAEPLARVLGLHRARRVIDLLCRLKR